MRVKNYECGALKQLEQKHRSNLIFFYLNEILSEISEITHQHYIVDLNSVYLDKQPY